MVHEYNSPTGFSLSDINLFRSHKNPSPGWPEGNFGTAPAQEHPLKRCPGHQVKATSIFLCTCCVVVPVQPGPQSTVPRHLNFFKPVAALAKNTMLRTTSTTYFQLCQRHPNNTLEGSCILN